MKRLPAGAKLAGMGTPDYLLYSAGLAFVTLLVIVA
jgi:hypothetical protein